MTHHFNKISSPGFKKFATIMFGGAALMLAAEGLKESKRGESTHDTPVFEDGRRSEHSRHQEGQRFEHGFEDEPIFEGGHGCTPRMEHGPRCGGEEFGPSAFMEHNPQGFGHRMPPEMMQFNRGYNEMPGQFLGGHGLNSGMMMQPNMMIQPNMGYNNSFRGMPGQFFGGQGPNPMMMNGMLPGMPPIVASLIGRLFNREPKEPNTSKMMMYGALASLAQNTLGGGLNKAQNAGQAPQTPTGDVNGVPQVSNTVTNNTQTGSTPTVNLNGSNIAQEYSDWGPKAFAGLAPSSFDALDPKDRADFDAAIKKGTKLNDIPSYKEGMEKFSAENLKTYTLDPNKNITEQAFINKELSDFQAQVPGGVNSEQLDEAQVGAKKLFSVISGDKGYIGQKDLTAYYSYLDSPSGEAKDGRIDKSNINMIMDATTKGNDQILSKMKEDVKQRCNELYPENTGSTPTQEPPTPQPQVQDKKAAPEKQVPPKGAPAQYIYNGKVLSKENFNKIQAYLNGNPTKDLSPELKKIVDDSPAVPPQPIVDKKTASPSLAPVTPVVAPTAPAKAEAPKSQPPTPAQV